VAELLGVHAIFATSLLRLSYASLIESSSLGMFLGKFVSCLLYGNSSAYHGVMGISRVPVRFRLGG
jgi:hypothetical protein